MIPLPNQTVDSLIRILSNIENPVTDITKRAEQKRQINNLIKKLKHAKSKEKD